ncbi:MAG: flagellar assembly peptidoglycan hydrolase FlgJ [Nevskiaceae bacterium]|nr:MAG: flagellar assembly peptidoglycan hydrolase FlgJ [Nevskiaceae bacterium]
MTAQKLTTDNVNDISQFTRLRAAARAQDPAALKAAARQFEALFTQELFKSMRAAKVGDDLMGSDQGAMYQDMFDSQMAQHLSQGRGLGIADLLVRQLQHAPLKAGASALPAASAANAAMPELRPLAQAGAARFLPLPPATVSSPSASAVGSANTTTATPPLAAASNAAPAAAEASADALPPVQFIKNLLPHAEEAARELGIPARTLVAQAALETGWGKHQMKNADGTPSYNFFGIKADRNWTGGRLSKHTTEYVDGSAQTQVAAFRSYASPKEAFKDYVAFIKANPRYAAALRHGGDGRRYAEGLQRAGYATDPAYAQKIQKISAGPTMTVALAAHGRVMA